MPARNTHPGSAHVIVLLLLTSDGSKKQRGRGSCGHGLRAAAHKAFLSPPGAVQGALPLAERIRPGTTEPEALGSSSLDPGTGDPLPAWARQGREMGLASGQARRGEHSAAARDRGRGGAGSTPGCKAAAAGGGGDKGIFKNALCTRTSIYRNRPVLCTTL